MYRDVREDQSRRQSAAVFVAYALHQCLPACQLVETYLTRSGFALRCALPVDGTVPPLDFVEESLRLALTEAPSLNSMEILAENLAGVLEDQGACFLSDQLAESPARLVEAVQIGDFFAPCVGPHPATVQELGRIHLLSVVQQEMFAYDKLWNGLVIEGCCQATKKELVRYLKVFKRWQEATYVELGQRLGLFASVHVDVDHRMWLQLPKGAVLLKTLREYWERRYGRACLVASPRFDCRRWRQGYGRLAPPGCSFFHLQAYIIQEGWKRDELWVSQEWAPYVPRVTELAPLFGEGELTRDEMVMIGTEDQLDQELKTSLQSIQESTTLFGIEARKYLIFPPHQKRNTQARRAEDRLLSFADGLSWQVECLSVEASARIPGISGPRLQLCWVDVLGNEWEGPFVQWDVDLHKMYRALSPPWVGSERREDLMGLGMLTQSLWGPLEQLLALTLEKREGRLPYSWAAEQLRILTAAVGQRGYVDELAAILKQEGVRVTVDASTRPLATKIYEADRQCVPFTVVVGVREEKRRSLSLRDMQTGVQRQLSLEELVRLLHETRSEEGVEEHV